MEVVNGCFSALSKSSRRLGEPIRPRIRRCELQYLESVVSRIIFRCCDSQCASE